MLPTPSTSHVAYDRIYEPAEDSFLLLDTLSSESERAFLQQRFRRSYAAATAQTTDSDSGSSGEKINIGSETLYLSPSPLVVEIGTGSGVVLSFVHAHAAFILGRSDILTLGIDVNGYACAATRETVSLAEKEKEEEGEEKEVADAGRRRHGFYLGNAVGDLTGSLRATQVDMLIFNPPYVPTLDLPALPRPQQSSELQSQPPKQQQQLPSFEEDSHLLELSYAGGADGMETTARLLDQLPEVLHATRGVAYILLCAQNKPEEVKQWIRGVGTGWMVETVGSSGKKAGWEKLQIIRIWRVPH